eukprot:TRINITY_DN10807_c2_g1_i1.p1 TRINITY_DN10807_c2_g1~~TRINITY_DN10807_c2_g1_i1.p1  ORF type:complete len:1310 (+),score=382.01 TRINITY_DN10807_c2_g1_i1:78-3932(+)
MPGRARVVGGGGRLRGLGHYNRRNRKERGGDDGARAERAMSPSSPLRPGTGDQPQLTFAEQRAAADAAAEEERGREERREDSPGDMPGMVEAGEDVESEYGSESDAVEEGSIDDEDSVDIDAAWERAHQGVPIEALLKHLHFRQLSSQLYADFLKYIPFLVMFSFFFLGIPGTDAFRDVTNQYYVVGVLKDKLMGNWFPSSHIEKYFTDTAHAGDWFTWASQVMVPNIWRCDKPDTNFKYLSAQGQNYLLGALRFRSLRVKNDSCAANGKIFTDVSGVPCWDQWAMSNEEGVARMGFPDPSKYPEWTDLVEEESSTADAVHLAELRLFDQDGPVDLSQAVASNAWGSNRDSEVPFGAEASNAIDGDRSTYWLDHEKGPLMIKLPQRTRIVQFTFTLASGPALRDPTQWRLEGSNIGDDLQQNWFPLHQRKWDYIPSGTCAEGPCASRQATQPLFQTEPPYNNTEFRYVRFVPTGFRVEVEEMSFNVNWQPGYYSAEGQRDGTGCASRTPPGTDCAVQIGEIRFRASRNADQGGSMDAGKFYGAANAGAVAWVEGSAPQTPAPPTAAPQAGGVDLLGNGTGSPTRSPRIESLFHVGTPASTTGPAAAIDGYFNTDWVDMQGRALIVRYPDLMTVKQVSWVTSSSHPWRDPVAWSVHGTNDDPNSGSAQWRLLWDEVNYAVPLKRNTQLPWFQINPGDFRFQTYKFTPRMLRGYPPEEHLLYQHRGCSGLTTDELSGWISGDISTYHCGGHEAHVPFNASCKTALRATWALGSQYPFMDNIGTRFIAVEFFMYTPSVNAYTSVKLFSEAASCGGWVNKWQIRSFSVFSDRQTSQAVFDFFFLAFVLYFLMRYFLDWRRDVKKLKRKIWQFPAEVWNIMELGNLITFMIVFILKYIWWGYSVRAKGITFPYPPDYPKELDKLLNLYTAQVYANAINTVITFLKFLKYVRLNSRLNLLTRTISLAKEQLISTMILFIYFVFCYTLCGVSLYGTQLGEYRNFQFGMSALSRMLLGDFDYLALRGENRVLTAFFFWSYVLLTFFIMLQFLIAILGTNFSAVSGDANNEVPFQEQLTRTWVTIKRALYPARIKRGFKLWLQGDARAGVLDRCVDNIAEHWRLLRTCSECGVPVTCVCGADAVDSSLHVKEHCSECGASAVCAVSGYHPSYYTDLDSRIVFRDELKSYFGEREYDLLNEGCNFIDDLWDEVMWDYVCELRFDPDTQKEETEGFVEKCVREYFIGTDGKALGALSELDAMETKFRGFELQVQNLLSLLQSERTKDAARPKSAN